MKITDHRSEIQNIATHSLSLISSTGKDSRDEQKISTANKKDLEQNTTDIPVVRQRQVLAIQKAPRTADIPLLQYIDTIDVPVAKQRRKDTTETARRLHDKVQRNPDGQEDVSAEAQDQDQTKKQNDTEVIHREVKGGTKTKCYLKENQSEFSETRRGKDLVKKHSEFLQCNVDCTSEDGCSQTKLTCQEHVPERIVEQIIEVQCHCQFGKRPSQR